MAYFSNGTEGTMWEEDNCEKCVHFYDDQGEPKGCPVWGLHQIYNYDQWKKGKTSKTIHEILETLIPTDTDGWAEQCRMFVERKDVTPQQETYLKKLQFAEEPVFGPDA